jgi:hypothetical protein
VVVLCGLIAMKEERRQQQRRRWQQYLYFIAMDNLHQLESPKKVCYTGSLRWKLLYFE